MTEAEWLACANPEAMLKALRAPDRRRLQLFACACSRVLWHQLADARKGMIEAAESFADSAFTYSEFQERARSGSERFVPRASEESLDVMQALHCMVDLWRPGALPISGAIWCSGWSAAASTDAPAAWQTQCAALRDIFGNPFRPVTVDPSWLTSDVVALARGIYDERAFDRMPILADALQDAGCDNDDILNHCRGDGPHIRGCWVVDLVLGKS